MDIIVFVGNVGIEKVIKVVGFSESVLFVVGCGDVIDEMMDVEFFVFLELLVDGFRNYL